MYFCTAVHQNYLHIDFYLFTNKLFSFILHLYCSFTFFFSSSLSTTYPLLPTPLTSPLFLLRKWHASYECQQSMACQSEVELSSFVLRLDKSTDNKFNYLFTFHLYQLSLPPLLQLPSLQPLPVLTHNPFLLHFCLVKGKFPRVSMKDDILNLSKTKHIPMY